MPLSSNYHRCTGTIRIFLIRSSLLFEIRLELRVVMIANKMNMRINGVRKASSGLKLGTSVKAEAIEFAA